MQPRFRTFLVRQITALIREVRRDSGNHEGGGLRAVPGGLLTKGAEKRRQHGSNGVTVFRDPDEDDRVWALFNWDLEGWQSFVSDPEVPAVLQEAGHVGRPQNSSCRRSDRVLIGDAPRPQDEREPISTRAAV